MASTVFSPGTLIQSDWLNDVNTDVYTPHITTFNTRTGAVTLTGTDVTNALGYTPSVDRISVTQYGAVGDWNGTTGTNNTPFFQAAINAANALGAALYVPPGAYRIVGNLLIDNSTDTGVYSPKMSLYGDGPVSSVLYGDAGTHSVLSIIGGTSGAGMHSHQTIQGIAIAKDGGGVGIELTNAAFISFRDIMIRGADIGVYGTDVLSSSFYNCQFLFNLGGVRFERSPTADGFQSAPNALAFYSCVLGNNANYGAWVIGAGNFTYIGGSVEGNGHTGALPTSGKYGILINDGGLESACSLAVTGTYFEYNHGTADIWLANSTYSSSAFISGCTFNRISNTYYTTHNIYAETSGVIVSTVQISGCGFKHYNTYVPSAARYTINQVQSGGAFNRISWDGCFFSSATDTPVCRNQSGDVLAYATVTAAGALAGSTKSMNISSVTKSSTGTYAVVYRQVSESVSPAITICTYGDYVASIFSSTGAGFTYIVKDRSTGTLTDSVTSFIAMG